MSKSKKNLNTARSSILPGLTFDDLKRNLSGMAYKKIARKMGRTPPLVNAGLGIGAFVVFRYAMKYYQDHPEIKDFIKENLENFEGKIKDYRASLKNTIVEETKH